MVYKKGQKKRHGGRYRKTKLIGHKRQQVDEETIEEKRVLKREREEDSIGEDIKRIRESL